MNLISTIEEFKQYASIDGNTNMETLQPFIDEAERLYLIDLLGQTFYDELVTAYTAANGDINATGFNVDLKKLFPYVQRPLAYYTLLLAIPQLTVTIGDMGIRQHRADQSDAAPRWKEEKLQIHCLKNGDIQADKLLEFLESNASVSRYATWFASANNTKMSGAIVYSSAIASKYISINNSRRVFLSIRNKIREIESRSIPKLIGKAQYDELVVQIKTGGVGIPTAANKELLTKLEPIISKRALYMQLPFMRAQVADGGVFLYSQTDEIFKGLLASDADIKILRQQLMDGEFGYVADEEDLRQFLLDNIDTYPLVKATGVYTSRPDPGPTWRTPDPEPNDKYFAV